MKLLLDTHVVLWSLGDPMAMSRAARTHIEAPTNTVAVSAASAWEISIKRAAGKLKFDDDLVEAMAAADFLPLPITVEHAIAAGNLPPHHRDPFDRVLIAQALMDGWTIVTRDSQMAKYNVPLLLA